VELQHLGFESALPTIGFLCFKKKHPLDQPNRTVKLWIDCYLLGLHAQQSPFNNDVVVHCREYCCIMESTKRSPSKLKNRTSYYSLLITEH
jgi:hypothetical protein